MENDLLADALEDAGVFQLEPLAVEEAVRLMWAALTIRPGLELKAVQELKPMMYGVAQNVRLRFDDEGDPVLEFEDQRFKTLFQKLESGATWHSSINVSGILVTAFSAGA